MSTAIAHEYKETLLTVTEVSLVLNGTSILRGVNAAIRNVVETGGTTPRGQVVALLGPSGMGKTQLFRVLAGLQEPTQGRVLINQHQDPVHAGLVGVVPQSYTLFSHRTVLGNLMVAARDLRSSKEKREKSMAMLERFGLAEKANEYPAKLSGGQRQRVAIAQQLLCSEHFLLMDEPFSGLDPLMVDRVCHTITEVANMNELNTIIVVTHDISSAVTIADTIWLMGREREGDKIIPGARIEKVYDVIERGLAWHPDIQKMPEFAEFVQEIKAEFPRL